MNTPTPRARIFACLPIFLAVLAFSSPQPAYAVAAKKKAVAAKNAQAEVEWVKVTYTHNGKDYVFYHPKNEPYTNDGNHQRVNLYKEPVLDDKYLARSHLFRHDAADKKFKLHIITEEGAASDVVKGTLDWKGAEYRPAKPTPAPVVPAQPVAQPVAQPIAQPPAQPVTVGPGPADPAPVTRAEPGPVPTLPPGQAMGAESPVSEIGREIVSDNQFGDVAKRLTEFTWLERAGNKSFIHPDTRKRAGQRESLGIVMKDVVKQPNRRQAALWVYYVIGAGAQVPDWVQKSTATKKYLVDDRALLKNGEEKLVECLGRWQHDPKDAPITYCNKAPDPGQKRIPYQADPPWVSDFVLDAGANAQALLSALTRGATNIVNSVGSAPGTTPTVPGGPGPRKPGIPGAASKDFTVDQLFGKWGDRNVFSLDGRIVALVVRTRQTVVAGNPPKTVISHQLGLYDISNEGDIYGRRFDMDKPGEQTFSLIPGGKQFKVTLTAEGGDMKIAIARPDGTPPVMSNINPNMPSVNELYQDRAKKALDSGNRVVIDGKAYRVTGEAAGTGNLIFWDEKQLEASRSSIEGGYPGATARSWVPSMMASVNKQTDGRAQNISNEVPLGIMGANGQWQGLRWNSAVGIWEPAEGKVFEPKPTNPDVPTSTRTVTSGGSTSGDGPPATPPAGTGSRDADGWPYLDRLLATAPRAAALNAKLSAKAKEHVRFYALPDEVLSDGPGKRLLVLLDKAAPSESKLFGPPYVGISFADDPPAAQGSEAEAIVNGRILLASTDRGTGFVDLEKVVAEGGSIKSGLLGYYVKGGKANTITKVTDMMVLPSILVAAGYPKEAEDAAVANLNSLIEKEAVKTWSIGGTEFRGKNTSLVAGVMGKNGERFYCVYPEIKLCNQGGDAAPSTVPTVGQGFPLDPAAITNVDDTAFQANLEVSGKPATRVELKPQPADAALYIVTEGEKKSWYIMALVTSPARKTKFQPTLVFGSGGDTVKRLDLPAGLELHSITVKGTAPESIPLRMGPLEGEVAKAGYIGAYGSQAADSCIGVVAVWGGTWQAACGKCGALWEGGRCVGK